MASAANQGGTLEAMPAAPAVSPEILEILRCPVTGSPLILRGEDLVARDDETIRYPIQHGVPRLLTHSATSEGHQ